MMIQANINAPCTLLDFPTLDRFIEEIRTREYDIVGISSIVPNIWKVKRMCQFIRQIRPDAKIVVGGHIANMPELKDRVDCDHVVHGEGIKWFREHLKEEVDAPIRHPFIESGIGTRNLGHVVKPRRGDVAAAVIPSVGCPLGCNFCSTSAMFGGKGKCVHFFETGDELFQVMCELESKMGVRSFFVMDENFLLHRKRALRLLKLMEEHEKSWSLYVFSSANVIRSYDMSRLVRMGISWVWMGIEGCNSQYQKLTGIDTFELVKELQSHGIRVLGSSIIGLENHTPDNIGEAIEYAAMHDTDFHQFMLYTPIPGTPLHAELTAKGLMKDEATYHLSDIHGQLMLNYKHPHLDDRQTAEFMLRAFNRDFERNGPSTLRIVRTTLQGYKRYKNHPNSCIRDRYIWEARELGSKFSAVVAATKLYYWDDPRMFGKMAGLLDQLHKEFGFKSRVFSFFGGPYLLRKIRQEEKRLTDGFLYEPPTFCERNSFVEGRDGLPLCGCTTPLDKKSYAASAPQLEIVDA
jgi:radical SAM superfamily enzyme YgiQ (UPF0313 family)